MPIRYGKVRRAVVVGPVFLAQGLIGLEPGLLTTVRSQSAYLCTLVEVVISRLPSVPTRATVNHDPHVARVAVNLHLDEVVATTDRTKLTPNQIVRLLDLLEVSVVRDGDVLTLAQVRRDAKRLGPVAKNVHRLLLVELGHERRAL